MNRRRRLLLPAWITLLVITTGCAGISRPSDLRPASHPLLEGVAPRTRLLPLARRPARDAAKPAAERATDAPPARTQPSSENRTASKAPRRRADAPSGTPSPAARATRAAIVERLTRLEGQRQLDDRPVSDMRLLAAAFDGIDGARDPGATITAARRGSRPVDRPRPGDLLFFHGAGGAAEVAVMTARRDDGAIEAMAVTREAVREIVVHPDDPHARRRAGRIVNTFLRTRRPDDEAAAAYLAGQLFIDARTLID